MCDPIVNASIAHESQWVSDQYTQMQFHYLFNPEAPNEIMHPYYMNYEKKCIQKNKTELA